MVVGVNLSSGFAASGDAPNDAEWPRDKEGQAEGKDCEEKRNYEHDNCAADRAIEHS